MLTRDLRELEAAGVVRRTVYAEVPPRVEYDLTPSGRRLMSIIDALSDWWEAHGADRASSDAQVAGRSGGGASRRGLPA